MRDSELEIVTVAPATAPPELSVIVPRTDVVACAQIVPAAASKDSKTAAGSSLDLAHHFETLAHGAGVFINFLRNCLDEAKTLLELCKA